MREKLPRYWKKTISKLTGLVYCDRCCKCGENNQLWWSQHGTYQWVPGWMNGADTHSIWRWLYNNEQLTRIKYG